MRLLKEGRGEDAVVLVHGYGQTEDEWGGFFIILSEELQKAGFTVYRFRFDQTTLSDEIGQLEAAIRQVRGVHSTIFLVGMSTGGLVAALEKEPVEFKAVISPVVDATKTFERLAETGHEISAEWKADAKRYSLKGEKLENCIMFYGTDDTYISAEEFESVGCGKVRLSGWSHGPETKAQMREISGLVAKRLELLR